MAIGDHDILHRAVAELRTHDETGWRAIEEKVLLAVRSAPRGGWPIDVDDPCPGTVPGTLHISDLVLSSQLSRALRDDSGYAVTDISVVFDETSLQHISIELSCRFMTDLSSTVDRVTQRSRAVIAEVIGDRPDLPVLVTVTDVYR